MSSSSLLLCLLDYFFPGSTPDIVKEIGRCNFFLTLLDMDAESPNSQESAPLLVINAQAAVQRCNATITVDSKNKPIYLTINNKEVNKLFQRVAGDMFGIYGVKDVQPMMGAEDFSFYQELIPGYFDTWLLLFTRNER